MFEDREESLEIAKLALRVEHNALIGRGSLGSLHERESNATLSRDENRVSHECAAPDKNDEPVVVRHVVDQLVWHGKESPAEWEHMGQTRAKRLGGLIRLNCRADEGEVLTGGL